MDETFKALLQSFASGGIPGSILAFILWKIAPAVQAFKSELVIGLRRVEEALDRSTRADILRLVASPHVSDSVKQVTADIIKDLDAAQAQREGAQQP